MKGAEIDEYPAVFTKLPSSVTGPGTKVSLHSHVTQSVDYEAELTLVIGKGGRYIAKEDAYRHIFGYTITNDVTARDRQRNHKQWFLGKTLDGFYPMGPWITTADEVDPENPAGVGIGFNPPKFLRSGDVVRISVSGIGELENTFV